MTTNAVGNDEWVGIDDISVSSVASSGNLATTTTVGGNAPSTYGQQITLSATVTPNPGAGNGTVSFFDNGVAIAGAGAVALDAAGVASFQISTLTAGTHAITAMYNGGAGYDASPLSAQVFQSVAPATLTVVSGITADDRVYDTTTSATPAIGTIVLSGIVGSDDVSVDANAAVGAFANANVGADKNVTISGLVLQGAAAPNYVLAPVVVQATIAPYALTVSGITASDRLYDGTTNASLDVSGATLSPRLGADVVTLGAASAAGSFANKNVGVDKVVAISGLVLGGADAGNYTINPAPTALADITAAPLTVTANNRTKTEGTTLNLGTTEFTSSGLQPGDVIDGVTLTSAGATASAPAGTYPITPSAATGASFSAANYAINYVDGTLTVSSASNVATTTTVAPTSASVYGELITISASVSPNPGDNGTVSFFDNGVAIPAGTSVPLNPSGVASFQISSLSAGNHPITAVYNGSAGFDPSPASAIVTQSVSPKTLTATAIAPTKVYNGDTSANVSYSLTGLVGSETVIATSGGTYASKDAGSSTVTLGPIALANGANGGLASNYVIGNTPSNPTGTITPKALTATANAPTKLYDGTTAASVTYGLTGFVGTETVTASGTGTFANANVGSSTVALGPVTLADGTNGGLAANYSIGNTPANPTGTITARPLTVTANNQSKPFGTTFTFTGNEFTSIGLQNGETIGSATFTTPSGGTAAADPVGTYPINVSDATGGTFTPTNYAITYVPGTLTVTSASNVATTTTVAPTSASVYGDSITISASVAPNPGDANGTVSFFDNGVAIPAGTNIPVNASGVASFQISSLSAGNHPITAVYNGGTGFDPSPASAIVVQSVSPKALTATANAPTKVYDGTTAATVTYGLTGFVGTETVTAAGTGTFANPNVGSSTVTLGPITLADGANGGLAANYSIGNTPANPTGTITARPLTVTANNQTKAFGTTFLFTGNEFTSIGLQNGETIGSATFTTPSGGTAAADPAGTYPINVSDATGGTFSPTNYAITYAPGTLTVTSGTTATTTTVSSTTSATYGQTVTLSATVTPAPGASNGTISFFDNGTPIPTGTALPIDASGVASFQISTLTAGNHAITAVYNGGTGFDPSPASAPVTQVISPKTLTVSGITASDKIYDADTFASLDISFGTISGVLGADDVQLDSSNADGQFNDKNVGVDKPVPITGLALTGADAGNYTLAPYSAIATISAFELTVTGITAADKVYNGTTAATLDTSAAAAPSPFTTDDVQLNVAGATGNFANKNAGLNKPVTISGLALTGVDAGNYTLAAPVTASADITPLALTVTGVTAANKPYDGTTAATLNTSLATLVGAISGDAVLLDAAAATGTFADAHAGTAKPVTISGLTLTGTDSGNYTLTQPTATADITPKALTVTGITANDKAFDGTTAATLNTSGATLVGVLAPDVVNLNTAGAVGTFDTPDAGTNKTVTISGLTIDNTDYTLTQPTATASITAAATTTTLVANPMATTGGDLVMFTATVAPSPGAAGTVTFKDNGTPIATNVPVSGGVAVFSTSALSAGSHSVTAEYGGSQNFAASVSAPQVVTVTGAASTTTLVNNGPNPALTTQSISFTVTVTAANPTDGDTVELRDQSNANALVASGTLAGGSASITVPAGALSAGTHNIVAVYTGNGLNAGSTSSPSAQVVTAVTQPQVVSVTPNGNIPELAGDQRSRVASFEVVFNQPVDLDANAITLSLHTSGVSYDGAPQPAGYGTLPTTVNVSTTDNITWVVSFTGNTDPTVPPVDGFHSLKDGVYNLNIDATKVHPAGVSGINMTAAAPTVFHRLFGDINAPGTPTGGVPGTNFEAILTSNDNLAFRNAFNKPVGDGYVAAFDFNGDGAINSGDNLQFRNRFNKPLTWSV